MERDQEEEVSEKVSEIAVKLGENLTLGSSTCEYIIDDGDEDEYDDEEFEFSFFGGDELVSPVSAEEAFHDGRIRSVFPVFGKNVEISGDSSAAETSYTPPVRRVFMVSAAAGDDDVAEGPYCEWSTENSTPINSSPAPEMNRKSNSTGFSRLWKMKDLLARSNSDGKDTLVFLTGKGTVAKAEVAVEKSKKGKKLTRAGAGAAYEALYGRKKGGGKAYLSYRQDLIGGFFTNVNDMTRNVHPY